MPAILRALQKFDGNRQYYDRVIADGPPTVDEDDEEGYVAGSEWVIGSTGAAYRCTSNAPGAAVWVAVPPGSALISDDGSTVTIAGNLQVNGTSTTINSTVVDIADRVIHVNHSSGANDPVPSQITGISVHRGAVASVSRDHAGLFWDEAAQKFKFAFNTAGNDTVLGAYLDVQALSFTGAGSGLTALNASNVSSGSLADARLSSNVPLKNAANTYTGVNTFNGTRSVFSGPVFLDDGSVALPNNRFTPRLIQMPGGSAGLAISYLDGSDGVGAAPLNVNSIFGHYDTAGVYAANNYLVFSLLPQVAEMRVANTFKFKWFDNYTLTSGTGYDIQLSREATSVLALTRADTAGYATLKLGAVRFAGSTSGVDAIQAAATAPSVTYTLPATAPTAGQVLSSTAGGVLSWITVGGGGVTGSGTTGTIPKWSGATALGDSALIEAATTITSSKRVFVPEGSGGVTVNVLSAGSGYGGYRFDLDGVYKGELYYQTFDGIQGVRVWSDVSTNGPDDDVVVFDLVNRALLPGSNNNQNIGSSTFRWQKLFSQITRSNAIQDEGDINRIQLITGGDLQFRNSSGTVNFSISTTAVTSVLDIVPNSLGLDLGNTTFYWDNVFASKICCTNIKDSAGTQNRIVINAIAETEHLDYNGNVRFEVGFSGVVLGDGAAIATSATEGHVKLPICSGPPTGSPGVGNGAAVYDTSNNRIYVHNGGTWRFITVV